MAGLVPAIHVFVATRKTWMPGTWPGMTSYESPSALGDVICRFATESGIALNGWPHHIARMGRFALIAALLALLVGSLAYVYVVSTGVEWPDMPTSVYVAMALGILFSLVVGCGLMALMFFSSRYGYDEAAHRSDERAERK